MEEDYQPENVLNYYDVNPGNCQCLELRHNSEDVRVYFC